MADCDPVQHNCEAFCLASCNDGGLDTNSARYAVQSMKTHSELSNPFRRVLYKTDTTFSLRHFRNTSLELVVVILVMIVLFTRVATTHIAIIGSLFVTGTGVSFLIDKHYSTDRCIEKIRSKQSNYLNFQRVHSASGLGVGSIVWPIVFAALHANSILCTDDNCVILVSTNRLFFASVSCSVVSLLLNFLQLPSNSCLRFSAFLARVFVSNASLSCIKAMFEIFCILFHYSGLPAVATKYIYRGLLYDLKFSFTAGEALIVATPIALLFADVISSFIQYIFISDRLALTFQHSVFGVVAEAIVLCGCLIIITAIHQLIAQFPFQQTSMKSNGSFLSPLKAYVYLFLHVTTAVLFTSWILDEFVLSWLFQFMLASPFASFHPLFNVEVALPIRWSIVCFWALVVVSGIIIAPKRLYFKRNAGTESVDLHFHATKTIVRKWFHILIVIILTPSALYDLSLTVLACCIVLTLFFVAEFVRVLNLPPFCSSINNYMNAYLDHRDQGVFVFTHIYLLVGCALPLLLHLAFGCERSSWSALSGIIVLGIGDAAASFFGTLFGRIRWPGTSKTLVGTLAGTSTMICFQYMIFLLFPNAPLVAQRPRGIFFISVLCTTLISCLESFTDQIDNLLLPLVYYAMLLVY